MPSRLAEIIAANQAFYDAFSGGDLGRMNGLWARRGPVICIHPGWGALTDRDTIMESWHRILEQGGTEVRCIQPRVHLHGEIALVVCQELLPGGLLVATNGFVREENTWRMMLHQAGPLSAVEDEPPTSARN